MCKWGATGGFGTPRGVEGMGAGDVQRGGAVGWGWFGVGRVSGV